MSAGTEPLPRASLLVDTLVAFGATHVVGIPDNGSAEIFACCSRHPELTTLLVSREGEAFAIASGLWLGGARPVVVVQNTGLLESGDALRGTATRMGVPLLCLVGYRGLATLRGPRPESAPAPLRPDWMTRADVDSAALVTEPTLRAWNLPSWRHATDDDSATVVVDAWEQAQEESRPVVVLLERGFA